MEEKNYYDDIFDTGLGGFSLNNIRKWIVAEAEESGDYENFIFCISDVVEDLILDMEEGIIEPDDEEEDDDYDISEDI